MVGGSVLCVPLWHGLGSHPVLAVLEVGKAGAPEGVL